MKQKTVEENIELCKKYPFLFPRSVWDDKPIEGYDYSWTELDAIPDGWRIAFGDMLIEEIGEALELTNNLETFRFDQIKEKYGSLRVYYHGGNEMVDRIIEKYSVLSENICMKCGKPDVYMTNIGWIYPCCKDCWENNKYIKSSYETAITGDARMEDKMKWRSMNPHDTEWVDNELDISATAEKIREEYKKRCENLE